MKLSQILGKDKITLSFEVFPPKTEANYEAVQRKKTSTIHWIL